MEESHLVPDPLGPGYVKVLRASNLPGRRLLRRGKVRDIYDLGGELLIVATDRISAFDIVYPTLIPYKGLSLHALSVYWFRRTRDIYPNHFIESLDERTMRVVRAERIDIEWICRAYLYGSAWRTYEHGVRVISGVKLPSGLQMAEVLPEVILTPTTKSEVGHDVEISRGEAIDRGLVTRDEWAELEEATYRLFEYYRREAERRGLIIPDFKLEFGRWRETLIQIDEPPTHDSARFWDMRRYEPGRPQEAHCLDKEFLREYLRRIGYTGDGEPPEIPGSVVREISKRCIASYEVLSGRRPLDAFNLKTVDEVMEELSDEPQ